MGVAPARPHLLGWAGYLIEDLNTVNGTYINGERISGPGALRSGDVCGLILEPSAIMQARKARQVLGPGDPGYGKAIAAEIIGWIGLALWIVAIIYQLSNM